MKRFLAMMIQQGLSYSQKCKCQKAAYTLQLSVQNKSTREIEKPNGEVVAVVESQPVKSFELSVDFSRQQLHQYNGMMMIMART